MIQDKIYNLIINQGISGFKPIPKENIQEIKNLAQNQIFQSSTSTEGKSFILELIPRGKGELANELSSQIKELSVFEMAALGKYELLREMISESPEQINAISTFEGMTPLHFAAGFSNSPQTVQLLIDKGADIEKYSSRQNIDSLTPVIAASLGRNYEILEMLLAAGANPNSQELESKTTALHIATFHQRIEHTKLLVKYGANVDLTTSDGRSSLDNANKSENQELVNVINEFTRDK